MVDHMLDYLAKLILLAGGLIMVAIIYIIVGIIQKISQSWLYVLIGAICASIFIFVGAGIISWLIRIYRKFWLSATQKQMICYLGKVSSGDAQYQDILSHLQVADEDKGQTHIERVKLQQLGLVHYSKGCIELTEAGWRSYDRLLQQEECNPDAE